MVSSIPLSSTPDRDHSAFAATDEDVTRPMCGHGVLTKILKKSPGPSSNISTSAINSSSSASRNCMVPGTKTMPLSRRRYEEVTRHLLASPEDTESSSTSSEKSSDDLRNSNASTSTAGPYIVQFVHNTGSTGAASSSAPTASSGPSISNAAPSQRQQMVQPLVFPRNGMWSTPLPAVTEETSSVETEETPRDRDAPLLPARATTTMTGSSSSSNAKFTSPEKEEMLEAMRNLVLKQQAALKELSAENTHFRQKMEEYQGKLLKMRRVSAEKDGKISSLQLEKEALEAESMYLRGQIQTLNSRLQASVDDEDDDIQQKLRSLMIGGAGSASTTPAATPSSRGVTMDLLSPSFMAERAASDAFNSFKRTLSPGTVMDRAVKSLNCSKDPGWGWEGREMGDVNDAFDQGEENEDNSIASESVPDDERIMSITRVKKANTPPKPDAGAPTSWASNPERVQESRDDELEDSRGDERMTTPSKGTTRTPPNTSTKPDPTESFSPYSDPVVWRPAPPPPPLPGKSYTPTRSQQQREEVDVFKQRLDSLQKRRSNRHNDRKQQSQDSSGNKPTVRFGTISI